MANLTGAEKPLKNILNNEYQFSIPTYQRPYSWNVEQAGELVSDLFDACENKKQEEYFLGSIVLIKEKNKPESDVVDGQQRLTTLTILFSALRHCIEDAGRAEGMNEFIFEKGNINLGTTDRPRLEIRDKDQSFFKTYIQEVSGIEKLETLNTGNITESQKRLLENFEHIKEYLSEKNQSELQEFVEFILQSCYLVVVSTDNFESAYRIFTVLNDRGMELSHTDILKAEIIGAIEGENDQKEYAEKWEDLEEDLGRDSFANLFAYIRMIVGKQKIRETILVEFRKFVEPTKTPKKFIDEELTPYAKHLAILRNADYEASHGAENVNIQLLRLNQIDNADWVPAALYLIRKFDSNPILLSRHLKKLERIASAMMIRRTYATDRIKQYGLILSELEAYEGEQVKAEDITAYQLSEKEQKEIIKALNSDIYEERSIRKFVLLRADSELSDGGASYNHKTITVEHVLPQNPKEDSVWKKWFSTEEMRKKYVHKLGNLLLLTRRKNSQASNYDFKKKKEQYFKTKGGVSNFAITTQVINEPKWTPEVVEKRQNEMLNILCETWDLDKVLIEKLKDPSDA